MTPTSLQGQCTAKSMVRVTHLCKFRLSAAIPVQTWTRPWGFTRLRLPRLLGNKCGKVVSPTHRPSLLLRKDPLYSFVAHCVDPIADGRIKSMKNTNYPIGNQTRDLPVCSAMPQNCVIAYPPPCSKILIKSPVAKTFPDSYGATRSLPHSQKSNPVLLYVAGHTKPVATPILLHFKAHFNILTSTRHSTALLLSSHMVIDVCIYYT